MDEKKLTSGSKIFFLLTRNVLETCREEKIITFDYMPRITVFLMLMTLNNPQNVPFC
jgi:hypothetical protein